MVTASGAVDSGTQQQALTDLGCSIGQGFLYGRPTPPGTVPVQLVQRSTPNHPAAVIEPPQADSSNLEGTSHGGRSKGLAAAVLDLSSASDTVTSTLRELLQIRSAQEAADLLQSTAMRLGADVVLADEASPDAVLIDLSLGEGPPLLPVMEPLSPGRVELERILPRLVEDAQRAVDLLRQTEHLAAETDHDILTGLATRRVLERVLARAEDGAVVLIDLDHLKRINDAGGPAAGDAVLAGFGRTLSREVRASDTTCRLGGEEFVVAAAGLDEPTALSMVDRIRAAWTTEAPYPITFSAGVAPVTASGGTAALLAADRALYRAKLRGRNRTEIASADSRFAVGR